MSGCLLRIFKNKKKWKKRIEHTRNLRREKKAMREEKLNKKRQLPGQLEIILGELHPSHSHAVEIEIDRNFSMF